MRYESRLTEEAMDSLRRRIAHAEQGWFFARVADEVARRRRELGMSQEVLAQLTGTTQSAIARFESGGRPPRIDTLLRLADALDCELVLELRPNEESHGHELEASRQV